MKKIQDFGTWVAQGATIGTAAVITAGLVSIAFAALDFSDVPTNVSAGNPISASAWNDLAYRVNKSVKQATQVISVVGSNVGIGTASPGQALSVSWIVESTSGGFKFPDGSVQSSAISGKILNVTIKNDCTRVVMGASPMTMTTFTVDKKSATSTLLIQGSISGHWNYSGDLTQGWKLGTSAEAIGQTVMYDENPYSKAYSASAVISGYATTGPQTMTFRYFAQNGGTAEKPFIVYNPNATDEWRLAQTCSVYTVWEIAP